MSKYVLDSSSNSNGQVDTISVMELQDRHCTVLPDGKLYYFNKLDPAILYVEGTWFSCEAKAVSSATAWARDTLSDYENELSDLRRTANGEVLVLRPKFM